jgi:hypothetical protein
MIECADGLEWDQVKIVARESRKRQRYTKALNRYYKNIEEKMS